MRSGCSICMRWDCCKARFDPARTFAPFEAWDDTANLWCNRQIGRKTDVSDAQWLQYLHAVGLLQGSFRPSEDICAIRSMGRHRESLVQSSDRTENRRERCAVVAVSACGGTAARLVSTQRGHLRHSKHGTTPRIFGAIVRSDGKPT